MFPAFRAMPCMRHSPVRVRRCLGCTTASTTHKRLSSASSAMARKPSSRKPFLGPSTGSACLRKTSRRAFARQQRSRQRLGDRLTVGQVPLTHSVQVRILVAQPRSRSLGESSPPGQTNARSLGAFDSAPQGETSSVEKNVDARPAHVTRPTADARGRVEA